MVVEDAHGKRLAIECDGYLARPEHKWADDMSRQRTLERAGWSFHRIWGPRMSMIASLKPQEDAIHRLDRTCEIAREILENPPELLLGGTIPDQVKVAGLVFTVEPS